MSRRLPHAFTESNAPKVSNAGPYTLSQITAGSDAWNDLFGPSVVGGLPFMGELQALNVSAVYSCVNLIAGAIAAMPLNVYRRADDGEVEQLPSDDLWWLLNEQMLPRWSAANGWEFVAQSKLLRGDGFKKIHRTPNGQIIGFEPLHYPRVQPIPTPDGKRLVYWVAPDPTVPGSASLKPEVLDQDDVLHYAGFGFDGVRGLSPLRHALRLTGGVANAAQEYSARFFANGARPDYVLATDGNVSPENVSKLREQIDERHNGVDKAHRPMILTQGLKPHALGLPAEEMQLLGTRQFQIEEICRIFGVPPFMVGHTDKTTSWGSGVEQMGVGFVRYALRRHLNKIENEANRKVYPRSARKVLRFDTTELERANFKDLIAGFRTAVGRAGEPGIMTPEEVRERLNLKRVPTHGKLAEGNPNASPAPAEPADS